MAAGGPTVTLTFAGNAGPLKKVLREVGDETGNLVKGIGVFGAAGAGAGAVAAGGLAAVPLALAGIGIAAAAQSEQVKSAFTSLKDHVVSQVQEMAKPFEPVLTLIASKAKATFDSIGPQLGEMFATAAPMVGQLADGVLFFIKQAMPGFQAAIEAAQPIIDVLALGIGDMGTAFSGFMEGLAAGAPGAASALSGIFEVVNGLLPILGELLGVVANALGPVFKALAPILVQVADALGGALGDALTVLGPPLAELITALGEALVPILPIIAELVGDLARAFVPIVEALAPVIKQLGEVLAPILDKLAPILGEIALTLGEAFASAIEEIAPILPPLVEAIGALVVALLPILPPLIRLGMELFPILGTILRTIIIPILRDFLIPLFERVGPILVGVVTAIADFVTGTREKLEQAQTKIKEFKEGIQRRLGEVGTFFQELPGKITGAIGNFGTLLVNTGRDLLTGLWNGITGAAGWLKSKIAGFFGSLIPGWAKDFLGIGSPSKVFRDEVGKWIPEGLAAGIEGNLAPVTHASQEMASAAVMGGQGAVPGQGTSSSTSGATAGGAASVTFHGNTSDALATVIMQLIRVGKIQIQ